MSEVTRVDAWRPNYARRCESCDNSHTVQGVQNVFDADGKPAGEQVVYDGTMCGVCTWGEADAIDPENW